MPLHLAKRMIEQRGGTAKENGLFLEVWHSGQFLDDLTISKDETVRFLDITRALARRT